MKTTMESQSGASQRFGDLLKKEPLVLVDFFAEWCGPCQLMKPILSEVKEKVGSRARIIKVDVDKNPEAAAHYQIRGVPTLAIFQKGELVWRKSGVVQARDLVRVLDDLSQ